MPKIRVYVGARSQFFDLASVNHYTESANGHLTVYPTDGTIVGFKNWDRYVLVAGDPEPTEVDTPPAG
jgi:hypothetical protein